MEIEINLQKNKNKIIQNASFVPMEEEEKEFEKQNPNKILNKKKQKNVNNESLGELNCSNSTNNSNTIKSMNNSTGSLDKSENKKKGESEIIFKVYKVNQNKKHTVEDKHFFKNELFDEIFTNLILEEKNSYFKIDKNYMKQQYNINAQMRAILLDWLIDVHYRFNFKRKTLFQTVYLIDLYSSKNIIQKINYQLLGLTCLFISVKANEVIYPTIEGFINLTDNAYKNKELLNMENHVLKTLDFDILASTPEEFYNILSKNFNFNRIQHHLGEYFLDSSLIDYTMLKYKYSTIAIACIYIVMKFYNLDGYKDIYSSKIISIETSHKLIKNCAKDLCYLVKKISKSALTATKNKYSSQEYDNVFGLCEEK